MNRIALEIIHSTAIFCYSTVFSCKMPLNKMPCFIMPARWICSSRKIILRCLLLNAYLTVLSSQEALDIAIKQASVDSAQVARLEIQNEQGAIPPATLSDLQGQYASDEVTVVNAVNALETAKVTLFSYLNVPYQKDAVYEMVNMNADISDLNSSSDSIYQAALQIIPTIKANDLRVQSFQKSIAVARGKMWPSLYFVWQSQFKLFKYCYEYDCEQFTNTRQYR